MATLEIGTFSSRCLACGRGASLSEKSHDTVLGYGVKPGEKGCGEKFDKITTGYMHLAKYVADMRPDLEYVEPWDTDSSDSSGDARHGPK